MTWLALAAGVLLAIVYIVECWAFPWATCGRCSGLKTVPRWHRIGVRDCPRCEGTGQRLRWGRRLWNDGADLHRRGTKK